MDQYGRYVSRVARLIERDSEFISAVAIFYDLMMFWSTPDKASYVEKLSMNDHPIPFVENGQVYYTKVNGVTFEKIFAESNFREIHFHSSLDVLADMYNRYHKDEPSHPILHLLILKMFWVCTQS